MRKTACESKTGRKNKTHTSKTDAHSATTDKNTAEKGNKMKKEEKRAQMRTAKKTRNTSGREIWKGGEQM